MLAALFLIIPACGGAGGGGARISRAGLVARSARVVNSLDMTMSVYRVDSPNGFLRFHRYVTTGATALSLALGPSGQFV